MEKQKGNATSSSVLKWEVFVTPGIPIGTPDRPAGITETLFQAMASTLIYGEREAVLVDTFMTVKQATELAFGTRENDPTLLAKSDPAPPARGC